MPMVTPTRAGSIWRQQDMKTHDMTNPKGSIIALVSLYFLMLVPVLPQVSTYHSDEHFYTDAAVYMIQHGDYLSPHYADGSLRTNKPILTYWAIMAGFTTLGVNFFGARLPFLLAGCVMVWLTYQMAMQLFKGQRVALLAAAILASNMQFLVLSLRATPDILQVLFMNISLCGFIAIAFNRDARLHNYVMIYFGAALVVLTKGLLGLVLVAFILAYHLLAHARDTAAIRITHIPTVVFASAAAFSWYAYMLFQHGEGVLGPFYTDQIGGKVGGSFLYIFTNVKDYLWGVFRNFLPWSLVLVLGYAIDRRAVHDTVLQYRRQSVFIVGWFALILAVFIFSTDSRTRYLVAAYPLLAVLMSALLWRLLDHHWNQRIWRWVSSLVIVLVSVAGVSLLAAGIFLQAHFAAGGAILLGGAAAAVWGWKRNRTIMSPVMMGILLLAAFSGPRGFVLPTLEFAPGRSLTDCLLRSGQQGETIDVWSLSRANYLRQLYNAFPWQDTGALLQARQLAGTTREQAPGGAQQS
jgi:4-amino-4-deoxy-L-arabinose transferase-like glycosyltransferase